MADTKEIGFTGLVQYNGQVKDDFLREFHGIEAYKRFNEMRLNNATIGAGLLAIEHIIRSMSWNFVSEEDNDPLLELAEDARKAMTQSWNDFISECLSFIWAGYSVHEKVYQRDSQGRILWRKFPIRGQDTIHQWLFDEKGGVSGVRQLAAPIYKPIDIPIEKLILFRTKSEKNSPEGRSMLRIAWVSYYYMKNLQQIEAIGFERDASGMPVVKLPQGANTNEDDINSDASKAAKIVRNIRNDEQAGLVLPFGWDAGLMSGAGKSFADLGAAIERYEKRCATAFFSQFLLLGQDGVGSLALSSNATDFFMASVNAVADIISETFTKFALRPLLKMNGATDEQADRVKLEHTPANSVDVAKVGAFIASIKDLVTWDANDELWLRQLGGMPERSAEELEQEREEAKQMKQEAARAFLERQNPQNDNQDNNTAQVFAISQKAEQERIRWERKATQELTRFFEGQRARMLKEARRLKNV